jgi:hypothetical protein
MAFAGSPLTRNAGPLQAKYKIWSQSQACPKQRIDRYSYFYFLPSPLLLLNLTYVVDMHSINLNCKAGCSIFVLVYVVVKSLVP